MQCRDCSSPITRKRLQLCEACYRRDYRKKNREKLLLRDRQRWYKQKYGLSLDAWEAMYKAQNGACKICLQSLDRDKRICVDHDHATGNVRSLLCHWCNLAIGNAKDNLFVLQRSIAYLRHHAIIKDDWANVRFVDLPPK